MASGTNFFFQNYGNAGEQELLESLTIEAMRIYGHDCYYIPRKITNYDRLLTEDDQSVYSSAYFFETYIESYQGFQGKGNFMSKFGLEIRDQVVFAIAIKTFSEEVTAHTTQTRPNEGDLIYFPLNKKCYQITYVEKFEVLYQLGKLYTWQCTTELFEYSNEVFNTGISDIDSIQTKFSTDILNWGIKNEAGAFLLDEDGNFIVLESSQPYDLLSADDSQQIEFEADKILDFSEIDPWAEGFH
jgi:hypothetical protein